MKNTISKISPQVGPRKGESHPSATAGGSPSYSGGGRNSGVGRRVAGLREHDFDPARPDESLLDSETAYDWTLDGQAVVADAPKVCVTTKDFGEEKDSVEASCSTSKASVLKELRVQVTRLSDSELSDSSLKTVTSRGSNMSWNEDLRFWRRKRTRELALSSDSEAAEEATGKTPSNATPSSKRGRSRLATTGQYVEKVQLKAAKTAELRLAAEEEALIMAESVKNLAANLGHSGFSQHIPEGDADTASAINRLVQESVDSIIHVADRSGNLKGGFVKSLKNAAASIKVAFEKLKDRTASEEVMRLEAANTRLSSQLADLRQEVAQLRQQTERKAESNIRQLMEEVSRSNIEQFGTMLNARLEGIECRLLPAPRMRPSLAADNRAAHVDVVVQSAVPAPIPGLDVPETSTVHKKASSGAAPAPELKNVKGKKKKKKKTLAAKEAAIAATKEPRIAPVTQKSSAEGWNEVVKRGGKKATNKKVAGAVKVIPQKVNLQPPRSAAITLTLRPGAEEKGITYASVMAEAKKRIDLSELGIGELRFKTAVTGARMLEIPGATAEKADSLAKKLRDVLGEDAVRVQVPVKCTEVRVTDLDDSATADEVVSAVVRETHCSAESIKPGTIYRGPEGSGSLWLRCPVEAAKKLSEVGRLRVGWVSARFSLLSPKPLKCFKCFEAGHVATKCTGEVDRSALCFRCGKSGHRARECTAEPHCAACAAAGKPATHAMSGRACPGKNPAKRTLRQKGARKAKKGPVVSQPSPSSAEEHMDTAQ